MSVLAVYVACCGHLLVRGAVDLRRKNGGMR